MIASASQRAVIRRLVLAALLLVVRSVTASAFPLLDAAEGQVPLGTELTAPDIQDLRHQLQLVNGLSAPVGGGWTFIPRLDWQEALTDNVLQEHAPRRADLVTFISPGFGLAGDLPRVRLTFDFAPTLSIYGRTGDLNSLTEQMNGLGNVTLVEDLAFVDVRALAGVHSLNGGLGGQGSVGAPVGGAALSQGSIPSLAGNASGLNKNNEVQTSSFGISPYLVHRFGDWGTGRLGASFDVTQSDAVTGFAAAPFPIGGANAQTLFTNEQTAHFVTGEILPYVQDSVDIDLQQSQTTSGTGIIDSRTGVAPQTTQHTSSTRAIASDQINYEVNREVAVFASGGHEDIHYSGIGAQSIHDLTWSLGTTLTPSADSLLTVSYGHLNGFNSLTANGHYALTPRTLLTVSYGSTLGTQLEGVQNQLNLATTNNSGALVNGQTGGQLFGATNALGVQTGVFRTTTLAVGAQTFLDRDIVSINLLMAKQTSFGAFDGTASSSKSASISWLHQMRPDMIISSSFAYAIQDQTAGVTSVVNPGNNTSIVVSLAWQWQISDTLSASMRYSFFERQSSVTAFDIYQNLLILGISKSF